MLLAEYADTLASPRPPGFASDIDEEHSRPRAPATTPSTTWPREPRAAAPLLRAVPRQLRHPARDARDGALRLARPAQRPALLAPRHGELPQSSHLLQRRRAVEGDVGLSLRHEPRRVPLPRRLRVGRRIHRPLRVGGQGCPRLPVARGRAARATAPAVRAAAAAPPPASCSRSRRGARRRAPASGSPTSNCTGDCWRSTPRRRCSSTPNTISSTSPIPPGATCKSRRRAQP